LRLRDNRQTALRVSLPSNFPQVQPTDYTIVDRPMLLVPLDAHLLTTPDSLFKCARAERAGAGSDAPNSAPVGGRRWAAVLPVAGSLGAIAIQPRGSCRGGAVGVDRPAACRLPITAAAQLR
jgi:hypothetical protein